MAGYFILNSEITNPQMYRAYVEKVRPILRAHGAKVLVAGGGHDTVEGEAGNNTVVLEFESKEAVERWYNSPEYQEILHLRLAASEPNFAIITETFRSPA